MASDPICEILITCLAFLEKIFNLWVQNIWNEY